MKKVLLILLMLPIFGTAQLSSEILEVEKHFRLGIAGAFATGSMGRAIYFMLSYNE